MNKRKNAFTLIELLGVIIILGVLALIIYPVITGTIKNQEKKTFKSSIEGILRAAKINLADDNYNAPRKYFYQNGTLTLETVGTVERNEKIPTEGKINGSGYIYIDDEGNIIVNNICDEKWCGYNKIDDETIIVVPNDGNNRPEFDPFAPIITLNGERNILLSIRTPYVEQGATAHTSGGVPLEYETVIKEGNKVVSKIDTNREGSYVITYSTTYSGITVFVTRNVKVIDPEPQITITQANSNYVKSQVVIISAKVAEPNTLAEFTYQINDQEITPITGSSISLDLNQTGTYTIKVKAVDSAGIQKEVTGGPYKIDATPPVITVPQTTIIRKDEVQNYDLLKDITIQDNIDGSITPTTSNVTIKGSLNAIPGDYNITYEVRDSLGNLGTVTRKITVYVPVNTWVIADPTVHGSDGANPPELLDNMIPVKYNVENNVSNKWYDYNQKLWANMVLIKADKRDKYKNSPIDTEVLMEDILGFYVWIPRFKYTIFNGNGGTTSEQAINVTFESGTAKTGTVSCSYELGPVHLVFDEFGGPIGPEMCESLNIWLEKHPQYSDYVLDNSPDRGCIKEINFMQSETCTDTTNGSITNGTSTYTHPAFTFGSQELTGFWFAKFEISGTINGTCTTSTCTTANLNVLPDKVALTNKTTSNFFYSLASMTRTGNPYGLTNVDSHMMKNIEWGAVSYLSHSKYGKTDRVYVNNAGEYDQNWSNDQQHFLNYTGRSSGSNGTIKTAREQYGSSVTNSTNRYSIGGYYSYDGRIVNYDGSFGNYATDRTLGTGASTSGNVTGVYDMSGGNIENTMAVVMDATTPLLGNSGFTTLPDAKYYDKYGMNANKLVGKLGDATVETKRDTTYITGQWYANGGWKVANFVKRGYFFNGGYSAGLFSYGTTHGGGETSIGTRNVIVKK